MSFILIAGIIAALVYNTWLRDAPEPLEMIEEEYE